MQMLRKLSLAGCKVQGTLPEGKLAHVAACFPPSLFDCKTPASMCAGDSYMAGCVMAFVFALLACRMVKDGIAAP
jgi:hypothetical protein